MKLGPFELRRVTAAQEPRRPPSREIGASGTVNLDGFLTDEDHNRDLRFPTSIKTYRRMRRSDPSIREAEQHIFAPILNASWEVEPASDDPLDLEIAEAYRRALFDWPEQPFSRFVQQALTHLSYGHMVFEQAWHVVEDELTVDQPDSEPRTLPSRQYLTWRGFQQRLPETITRWIEDDGRLVAIEQQVWRDERFVTVEIPAENLLVFTHEQEGNDYRGVSMLRTAFKPWFLAERVQKTTARAIMRHGVGTWVGYPPSTAENDEAVIGRMEEILKGIGIGDLPYIVAPGRKASENQDGYLFEVITPQGQIPELVKFLEYLRGEIKGNVLARFAELGHGSVGARATGDVQSQVWYAALHMTASGICDVLNRRAAPQFVRANWLNHKRFPKLVVEDIESRSLEEFADAVSKATASGAVVADRGWRAFVRRGFDGPEEDDPDAADRQANPEPEDEPEIEPDPDEEE